MYFEGSGNSDSAFLCEKDTTDPNERNKQSSQEVEGAQMMTRPTLKSFKKKAFNRSKVKEQYEVLTPAYELRKKLVSLRQGAGLTQEQLAEILHTNKSNISRLESVNSNISPKLSTIADYAEAIGYEVKIEFIPINEKEHNNSFQRIAEKRSR